MGIYEVTTNESERLILPAHIEETIRAISKLHSDHEQAAGPLQRTVERITAWIGQGRFITVLVSLTSLWIVGNLISEGLGRQPWDPPPFNWLELVTSVLALYVTVLILATQRRDDQIAAYREQLTLELAILGEQKSAKIISLLEEIRQEHPHLANRVDSVASEMAVATDPQTIIDAIRNSEVEGFPEK